MGHPAVLITGGNGYLAQHTLQALLRAECARVGYTCRSSVPRLCDAQAYQLDLLSASAEDIATMLRDFMPDVVLHLAASSALGACETDKDTAFTVNAVRSAYKALTLSLLSYLSHTLPKDDCTALLSTACLPLHLCRCCAL
jgi:dTDP-4-dehydrorhamnose reductase